MKTQKIATNKIPRMVQFSEKIGLGGGCPKLPSFKLIVKTLLSINGRGFKDCLKFFK